MTDLIKNNNFSPILKAFDVDQMSEMLEEASRKGGRESKFTTKKTFSPSSFYDKGNGVCPRYWVMAFRGANFEYDNTARQRANMDAGTAAGERIADLFENAGILKEAEAKATHSDPPIFGFIDLIVNWQGEEMIGEVKTTRTESFSTRAAQMKAPGYQLLQLLIYMYVKNKEKGFFVVEDKNTHELLVIPIKMTEERKRIVENAFDWMRKVRAVFEDGDLPTRPFTQKSTHCKSCPIQKDCWAGYVKQTKTRQGSDPNPGNITIEPLVVPK